MFQCETEGRGTAGRFDDLVKARVIGKGGQSPCAQPGRNIPSGFRAVDNGDIVDSADLSGQGCGEETDGTGSDNGQRDLACSLSSLSAGRQFR